LYFIVYEDIQTDRFAIGLIADKIELVTTPIFSLRFLDF